MPYNPNSQSPFYGPEIQVSLGTGAPNRKKIDLRIGAAKYYWSSESSTTLSSILDIRPGIGDIPATVYTIVHEPVGDKYFIISLNLYLWRRGTRSTQADSDTYAFSVYEITADGTVEAPLDNLMLVISGTKFVIRSPEHSRPVEN
jgi:hypothetical protein